MAAAVRSLAGRLLAVALLVSLASSFLDQKQLEELKANIQSHYKQLEVIKERRLEITSTLELLGEYATLMGSFRALVKRTPTEAWGLTQFGDFMEKTEDLIRSSKTQSEAQNEALGTEIADMEKTLGQYEAMIKAMEEYQAEL